MSMNEINKERNIYKVCMFSMNHSSKWLWAWVIHVNIHHFNNELFWCSLLSSVIYQKPKPKHKEKDIRKSKNSTMIWNKKKTKKKKKNPPLKYTSDNIYLVNVWYFPNFRKTTFAHSISFSFFFFTLVCSKPLRKWRENMHCC